MAPVMIAKMSSHPFEQSLHSAALELKYERSSHLVDIITKEENIRKLKFNAHVLEDDNTELRELLSTEQERSDKMEGMMNEHLARAEEAEAAAQALEESLQTKDQEIASLQSESRALKNLTTDTSKIVTEKLELTHELSRLKPELEHLRAQVSANEGLLTEKLSLQRRMSEIEVELENSKRDAQRAMAKRRNTMAEVAQEDEMESLRKSLSKEKRLHERAKETIAELEAEMDSVKKNAQKDAAVETKEAEKSADAEVRAQELTRDLAKEQKEKTKAERALQRAQTEWEASKSVLEDRLTQYKNRVRTLKDRLKETEESLETAQSEAAAAAAKAAATAASKPGKDAATAAAKAGRKRNAGQLDVDATTLGTPGDAPAKRARRGANVGEKSSFSITPFLNRTMSMGEGDQEEASDADEPEEATPTTKPKAGPKKRAPLQPASATAQNIPPAKRSTTAKPAKISLQVVTEEEEPVSPAKKPASTTTSSIPLAPANDEEAPAAPKEKTQKPKPKVRKSLAMFTSFNLEPAAEMKKPKSKSRKLGGLGKTLFDDEGDDDAGPAAAAKSGRGLFGAGKMGPLAGNFARGSFLAGPKRGQLATGDGFVFSPLKKERKAGASFLK